jgi:mannose-6-phosphate isomerase-like protein (cupin superfamily)
MLKIGKISEQQEAMRGWLVGQFFPEDSPFHDKKTEIYFKSFPKGDAGDKLHVHPQGIEYLIVLDGIVKIRVGDEEVILEKGDYITITSNTPDKIVEIMEDVTIIGVRHPSIPDNKVFLE